MSAKFTFLDTNILVYSLFEDSPHHQPCKDLIKQAQTGKEKFAISPSILGEWYAVITDPRRVTTPYEPTEAVAVIQMFLSFPGVNVLSLTLSTITQWLSLLSSHSIQGGAVFDVLHVATMLSHQVNQVYTFDDSGFAKFSQIEILRPH